LEEVATLWWKGERDKKQDAKLKTISQKKKNSLSWVWLILSKWEEATGCRDSNEESTYSRWEGVTGAEMVAPVSNWETAASVAANGLVASSLVVRTFIWDILIFSASLPASCVMPTPESSSRKSFNLLDMTPPALLVNMKKDEEYTIGWYTNASNAKRENTHTRIGQLTADDEEEEWS
jgi:hypothetical protein